MEVRKNDFRDACELELIGCSGGGCVGEETWLIRYLVLTTEKLLTEMSPRREAGSLDKIINYTWYI